MKKKVIQYNANGIGIMEPCNINVPMESEIILQGPVSILDNGGYIKVYQVEYSKGSYEDCEYWCGDVYFKIENAQKEMDEFKEKNSIESFEKQLKVTTREYWENTRTAGYYANGNVEYDNLKQQFPEMTDDEFACAYRDDHHIYTMYIEDYNSFNYNSFRIIERKLKA